ncbi:response regulator transcription factor [Microvirga sp. 2MCAF38]|uniref:response regulator n=1 Tax=Microvirga sp. 2MCAF38 TaxID=3232989 RepID=UPI003F9B4660
MLPLSHRMAALLGGQPDPLLVSRFSHLNNNRLLRILIAAEFPVVRCGLRAIIEGQDEWQVVGEVAKATELLDVATATEPDIVIFDPSSASSETIEAIRALRVRLKAEVLIFSARSEEGAIRAMVGAGARGYVLKADSGEHLLAAIGALAQHRTYFTWRVSAALINAFGMIVPDPGIATSAHIIVPRK